MDSDDEEYLAYLKHLDPNDWKNQDHYRVLGISKLRWRATASQIRVACNFQSAFRQFSNFQQRISLV